MHTLFCLIVTTTCSEIPGDNTSNIWNPDMKKMITIPAPINKTAKIAGDMVNRGEALFHHKDSRHSDYSIRLIL